MIKKLLTILALTLVTLGLAHMTLNALIHEQDNSPRPSRGELQNYCDNGMQAACDALRN